MGIKWYIYGLSAGDYLRLPSVINNAQLIVFPRAISAAALPCVEGGAMLPACFSILKRHSRDWEHKVCSTTYVLIFDLQKVPNAFSQYDSRIT